jgi:hypothetical protein
MRRLLPALFCVAASTGLTACDQPVSGPTPDDEQELYNEVRKAGGGMPAIADGDVTLSRTTLGGQKDPVFVIQGGSARTALGVVVQDLSDAGISAPGGGILCTKATVGGFVQLVDADGTVLFSSVGPFVFEGQPQLAGKNPAQQAQELASRLRFSYDFNVVMEGFANSGEEMVEATVPVQFASGWRKLVIASLVDGYCGSDGLPD